MTLPLIQTRGGFTGSVTNPLINQYNQATVAANKQIPSYVTIGEDGLLRFNEGTTNSQMVQTLVSLGLISEDDYNWFIGQGGIGEGDWMVRAFNAGNEIDRQNFFAQNNYNDENEARFRRLFNTLDQNSEAGGFTPSQSFLTEYGFGTLGQPGSGYGGAGGAGDEATPRPVFIGQPPTGGTPEQPYFSTADILVSATEQPNLYDTYDPYAPFEQTDPYSGQVELQYPYQPPEGGTPPLVYETQPATPLDPFPQPYSPAVVVPEATTPEPIVPDPTTPDQMVLGIGGNTEAQWSENKNFIIAQVNAGTATPEQQQWYNDWISAGEPSTQAAMNAWRLSQQNLLPPSETDFPAPLEPGQEYVYDRDRFMQTEYGDPIDTGPMSFPTRSATNVFLTYDNAQATIQPDRQESYQGLLDRGIVDSSGRLLVDNLNRDDLYQIFTGGLGLGENDLHNSLIQQAGAAFRNEGITFAEPIQQTPPPPPQQTSSDFTFGGLPTAPEPTFAEQRAAAEQAAAEEAARQQAAAQQTPPSRFSSLLGSSQNVRAPSQPAIQPNLEAGLTFGGLPTQPPSPSPRNQTEAFRAYFGFDGAPGFENMTEEQRLTHSMLFDTPYATRSNIDPAELAAARKTREALRQQLGFADGGIVSMAENVDKVNGQGIESFLMQYQSPEAVSQERRAATLRRNLRAIQPQPTAQGPVPTMQQGIVPMARR